uniref:Peptidase M24 domain-containing protein n=1 Tax=Fagus sylvatica TaxID=28930 RepID=A0A2N9EZC8_FAGSY
MTRVLSLNGIARFSLKENLGNDEPGYMVEGQTFTIEPILTLGSIDCITWTDNWTAVTADGSPAAQFEHSILITRVEPSGSTQPALSRLSPMIGVVVPDSREVGVLFLIPRRSLNDGNQGGPSLKDPLQVPRWANYKIKSQEDQESNARIGAIHLG